MAVDWRNWREVFGIVGVDWICRGGCTWWEGLLVVGVGRHFWGLGDEKVADMEDEECWERTGVVGVV